MPGTWKSRTWRNSSSKIKEQFKKETVQTSKSGKTTQRALKTVENKLAKKNETEETQELLLKWLNALKATSVKGVFEGSKLSDLINCKTIR